MVRGYSRVQIALHWAVVLLIIVQLVTSGAMGEVWKTVEEGGEPVVSAMVWGHVNAGIAVLLLALWRIGLRLRRGVPAAPDGPALLQWTGRLAQLALYALLILVPVSGMMAWFGGNLAAAGAHVALKNAILALVLLHVVMALYHQFVRKDGLMDRMSRPEV